MQFWYAYAQRWQTVLVYYGTRKFKSVLSLHTCAQSVGDSKVNITWQGHVIRTFSVYRKENLNLPNGVPRRGRQTLHITSSQYTDTGRPVVVLSVIKKNTAITSFLQTEIVRTAMRTIARSVWMPALYTLCSNFAALALAARSLSVVKGILLWTLYVGTTSNFSLDQRNDLISTELRRCSNDMCLLGWYQVLTKAF